MVEWPDLAPRAQLAGQRAVGESVTYMPGGGAPVSIRGVFTDEAVVVELMDGVAVQSSGPKLSVHLADLEAEPAKGDGAVARGRTFKVLRVSPDGEGDADLFLEEV